MKTFIRTLNQFHESRLLWHDYHEREAWRNYLNSLGFYVTTGTGDSLDVFVIPEQKTALDKLKDLWYTLLRRIK